jgi:catechol 2,3-dioxygenase-like lactoylglutathione lyase family enzyme
VSRAPEIRSLSAVTLATADMARSVGFYRSLGFALRYGGESASFTSFTVGESYLNLELRAGFRASPWGRTIFYVSDVDRVYERARELGFTPAFAPRDAPWGERFFHLVDPDGHELSFAKPLAES